MASPCARTTQNFARISAKANSEWGPLTEGKWLIDVEEMPTIVTHTCKSLAGEVWEWFHNTLIASEQLPYYHHVIEPLGN